MEKQIPEAWIGQEVVMDVGAQGTQMVGTLAGVSDRGYVLEQVDSDGNEITAFLPSAAVVRILHGYKTPKMKVKDKPRGF